MVRLKGDGSMDGTYGDGDGIAVFDAVVPKKAILQPDGKLLFIGWDNSPLNNLLACRLTAEGDLDTSYGGQQSGCRTLPDDAQLLYAIALQPDGRVVVAGEKMHNGVTRGVVYRLDAQGNPDSSFDGDGEVVLLSSKYLHDIAVASDGKVVVVGTGSGTNFDFEVYRLLGTDGSLDDGFGEAGRVTVAFDLGCGDLDVANAVSLLSDGSILVAGDVMINENCERRAAIAKLSPIDGSLVNEFAANGIGIYETCPGELGPCAISIEDMLVQSDDRIVLAGTKAKSSGVSEANFFVLRLLETGYADSDFGDWWGLGGIAEIPFDLVDGGDTNTQDMAYAVASHGGRIVVAGSANVADGQHFAVARLTNDRIFTDDYDH